MWVLSVKIKDLGSVKNKIHNLSTFKIEKSFSTVLGKLNEVESCSRLASKLMEHNLEYKKSVVFCYFLPGLESSHKEISRKP